VLFYVQMKWNFRDLSFDELMKLEAQETEHAAETIASKMVVGIWKVASQHRVIAVVDVDSAEQLDYNSMFGLPMRGNLEFEVVWPLCDYQKFANDLTRYIKSLPHET
jgi:muconolactone delta-isomerase